MTERRYTLAEIDAMRAGLYHRVSNPFLEMDCYNSRDEKEWLRNTDERIERELRTAMLGGVDPAEFTNRKKEK